MYFPIPIPFDNEYPVILNLWEPLTVSVIDVDDDVAGAEEGDAGDEFEEGRDVSRIILPMREKQEMNRKQCVETEIRVRLLRI